MSALRIHDRRNAGHWARRMIPVGRRTLSPREKLFLGAAFLITFLGLLTYTFAAGWGR